MTAIALLFLLLLVVSGLAIISMPILIFATFVKFLLPEKKEAYTFQGSDKKNYSVRLLK